MPGWPILGRELQASVYGSCHVSIETLTLHLRRVQSLAVASTSRSMLMAGLDKFPVRPASQPLWAAQIIGYACWFLHVLYFPSTLESYGDGHIHNLQAAQLPFASWFFSSFLPACMYVHSCPTRCSFGSKVSSASVGQPSNMTWADFVSYNTLGPARGCLSVRLKVLYRVIFFSSPWLFFCPAVILFVAWLLLSWFESSAAALLWLCRCELSLFRTALIT